jgi:hypothetical protein
MFELDDIRPLGRKCMGLPVYDAGDGERWAVGDDAQVNAAIGQEVIEALRHVAPEVTTLLAPILGRELTDLMRAAAEPRQREFGLFLYRLR